MTTISDLSCIGPKGKPIHGTAAILHRMFGNHSQTEFDMEAFKAEYVALVKELGYSCFEDD